MLASTKDAEAKTPSPALTVLSAEESEYDDDAAQFVGLFARTIDPKVERRAVRKIDLFLMPTLLFGYCLVFYDKAILGSSSLLGMTADLSLSVVVDANTVPPTVSTSRLSWATAIFYFGMLVGLYPMTLLFQRFPRALGPLVILWGIVALLTAVVTTWQGLFAQRFFLGFVESVVPTGFAVIVSGFYNQREQGLRQSIWYSANGLGGFGLGAVTYGFARIQGGVLPRWRYLYLFAGSLTILFGVFCCFLPASPIDAWFLTHEEKIAAVERLRKNQAGVRSHKIKLRHIKAAVKDVKYWLIALMMAATYTANGVTTGFGPLIVSTFGWSSYDGLLLTFPFCGVAWLVILVAGYVCSRFKNTILMLVVLSALVTMAAFIIIWKSTWSSHAAAPIVGYTLIGFYGASASCTVAAGMSNVASATAKSIMASTIFIGYCVGNIIGPNLVFSQSKSQHYPELWTGLIICYCILILASVALGVHLYLENCRRDKMQQDPSRREENAFKDLSDRENIYFRYRL